MKLTRDKIKKIIEEVVKDSKTKSMILSDPNKKIIEVSDRLISLQRLDEASMAGIQGKYMDHGFIVITSDRSCEAELGLPEGEVLRLEFDDQGARVAGAPGVADCLF